MFSSIVNSPTDVICSFTADVYKARPLFQTGEVDYNIRIFPLQVSVICATIAILQVLLKPFGETPVVAQILGGILLGSSCLLKYEKFYTIGTFIFPTNGGTFILETFGNFGCILYLFLIGVKMDLSVLMRSSRKERAIGVSTFLLPLLFTVPISYSTVWKYFDEDYKYMNVTWVAITTSTTSFPVIACFLSDLKILNTELGRIATSASTISGMCSWVLILVITSVRENKEGYWGWYTLSGLAQIIFIIVVLRAIVIWMIKQTPERQPMKESYIFSIIVMVLVTGLLSEWYGQHFSFGPLILGLAIPHGPPIGSALAKKFETFTSGFFLPMYFSNIGFKVNVFLPSSSNWEVLTIFSMLGLLGKLWATLIVCRFYGLPVRDSFILGLCLSTRGILDVENYRRATETEVVTIQTYAVLVTISMVIAAVIAPVVHWLYDPSRRYTVYKNRTIQNVKPDSELRILVVIFNEDSVPTISNIIEASNPTRENPIIIYLLHIVELIGRSNAELIAHKPHGDQFNNSTSSGRIINSFRICEKKNQGAIYLQPFTSISPLSIAQEDVCTLALNKKTSFIIIPFHKQWNIDGSSQNCIWRNANKKILKYAPCSVGMLIDRGVLKGANRSVLSSWSTYSIGLFFLGGIDDREALCYGMRMVGNQHVNMTVYRLLVSDNMADDVIERIMDEDLINEYKTHYTVSGRNLYKENMVKDGVEIISVIQTMEATYDLILVGRSHESYSSVFSGLLEWNEYPELGFFGDMLASSDFKGKASVLVMQQHCCLPRGQMRHESQVRYRNF